MTDGRETAQVSITYGKLVIIYLTADDPIRVYRGLG